jgi:phage terminase large subunit-like protein
VQNREGPSGVDEVVNDGITVDAAESVHAAGGGYGEQEDGPVEAVGDASAEDVIFWIENTCYIPEGSHVGRQVELREWQKDVIRGIYGSPTRRAIVSFGRKNGKTGLAAFLLLCHLCGPKARRNAQLYSAAQSRDQAGILFNLAAKIVRMSPILRHAVIVKDSGKQLVCPEIGTVYKALSADASTAYGLSPVFCVHDELGQVRGPRSELYEALETAAGAQDEPLSIVISTQAPTDSDLLSILIEDAKTGADPRVKLSLYTAPEDMDPFSEEAIRLANPAFNDFLNAKEVMDQAASAKRMPSREAAYRNLILNQRIDATNPLISRTVWSACGDEPQPWVGPVYAGLDLSARNDLTALVLIGRDDDGIWSVRPEFWTPENGLRDRAARDRAPYDVWASQGYLHVTPGATVDYEWVARRLVELCEEHEIAKISFDRWRIDLLKNELGKVGAELPLEPFGQGYKSMAPAIDNLEAALLNCQIRHGNHPVLTWCAANAVATRDPAGNRKLDKAKATGRIDGVVALTMAFGVADLQVEEYAAGGLVLL